MELRHSDVVKACKIAHEIQMLSLNPDAKVFDLVQLSSQLTALVSLSYKELLKDEVDEVSHV